MAFQSYFPVNSWKILLDRSCAVAARPDERGPSGPSPFGFRLALPARLVEMDAKVRAIVAVVLQRCRERGDDVTPALAAFFVQAQKLAKVVPADAVDEFVDHCATRLAAREDPALETLKMQLAIEDTAATQTKTAAKEARDRDDRVGALERDVADAVVDSATVSGREERLLLDRLHDAAFRYVCVACRMEIALEDDDVAEETRAAFESVFPRHDLRRFFTLPPDERSLRLRELASVVLGVRVYNRSVGDGGLRLDDPTPRYLALADATKADLDAKLASTERLVGQYAVVIAHLGAENHPCSSDVLRRLTDEHNNRRCYGDALRRCAEECARGAAAVRALSESLDGALATVRRMLAEGGDSASRAEAFPRLDAAGALHLAIVEETEAQAANLGVVKALLAFARPFATTLTNRMLHDATFARKKAEERRVGENLPWHLCVAPPVFEENRHLPGRIDAEELALAMASKAGAEVCDAGATVLEYGGYDVHAIVKRGGLLRPASTETPSAAVTFEGKTYGFADRDGALQFASQPERYLNRAERALATRPELIHAARGDAVVRMDSILDETSAPSTAEFGAQTPTHFVERRWDANYEWNEWALRRRALRAANIRGKLTRGAQTDASHFRRDGVTQTWARKHSVAQTAAAKATTMPKKVRYVGGLRGGPEVKMNVVSLELDLGQPHDF